MAASMSSALPPRLDKARSPRRGSCRLSGWMATKMLELPTATRLKGEACLGSARPGTAARPRSPEQLGGPLGIIPSMIVVVEGIDVSSHARYNETMVTSVRRPPISAVSKVWLVVTSLAAIVAVALAMWSMSFSLPVDSCQFSAHDHRIFSITDDITGVALVFLILGCVAANGLRRWFLLILVVFGIAEVMLLFSALGAVPARCV
jgi:hypothetical protein